MFRSFSRRELKPFLLTTVFLLTIGTGFSQTANYILVDNIEEDWVNLNLPPIRPMLLWQDAELYTVNTHGNTVLRFNDTTGLPLDTFRVPWGPVSIAGWISPQSEEHPEQLLVVCRGSYVLVFLDRISGETLNILELPAEPGDILVDQNTNQAYISCAAQDRVVEIDLLTISISRSWTLPAKNPLFLSFDDNEDVLVSPLFSGNNSAIHKQTGTFISIDSEPRGILDLADPAIAVPPGLPDQDLFRIVRSGGTVQPVTRGMGTILFANGVNPTTGQVWQIGTDANNKDPNKQTEPAINGEVVRNILSIANLPLIGAPPNPPVNTIDLDDSDTTTAGVQIDTGRTVGQPYGLFFADNGFAFVTGLLTDNVTLLNPNGDFILEWDVPDGSIPRAVIYSSVFNLVFVYCWGTNKIEAFTLNAAMTPFQSFDLGFDPTPDHIKKGRQVYYDGFHSQNNNASCNSCHVEGKADNLAWNLSNDDKDDKGPMMTQLLAGIDRLRPFHWRGERDSLIFFNQAFTGLLGARKQLDIKPGSDFDNFEAFVLSMRNPANPNVNETRVLDDSMQGPKFPNYPNGRAATTGQTLFIVNTALNCERCHNLPLSTNNEVVSDDGGNQKPRRQRFKVTPFHEIYRKEMDSDTITPGIQTTSVAFNDPAIVGPLSYPLTGFGFAHTGAITNLHHFIQQFENPAIGPPPPNQRPLTLQESSDLFDFAWQFDNGMGLAVHRAYLMNQANVGTVGTPGTIAFILTNYLENQAANRRNCSIAVYGTSTIASVSTPMAWAYNRTSQLFEPEDGGTARNLGFFIGQAQAGQGVNVFVGLPVGMAPGFAIDFDRDDLLNMQELATFGSDPFDKDSDGDRFWDGHEVANGGDPANPTIIPTDTTSPTILTANGETQTQWFTSRVATLVVYTDEPTAISVNYMLHGGAVSRVNYNRHRKVHRIVLSDLKPSGGTPAVLNTYVGNITVTDLAGLSSSIPIPAPPNSLFTLFGPPPITTRAIVNGALLAGDLRWRTLSVDDAAGTIQGTARIRVEQKAGGPPAAIVPGAIAIFRILKNGQPIAFTTSGPQSFSVDVNSVSQTYDSTNFPRGLTGPFLISDLTDTNGEAEVSFSASGFATGDVVVLNLDFIGLPGPNHSTTNPELATINAWSMPDNTAFNFPGDCRGLDVTFK